MKRRFLALGDSYTIGEAVSPSECWPSLLAAKLALAQPVIVARTGWTTDELAAAIDAAPPAGIYDLVTLLIGVNDQYRGRSVDEYRRGLVQLLERAVRYGGGKSGRVVTISIPDWGVTPFAEGRDRKTIAAEIDRFNEACRDLSRRLGARYVDITGTSRVAGADPGLTAADGLHPSPLLYERWVEVILPEARAALETV